MRTVYGNHERYETTYFKKFPGYYCTGDGKYIVHLKGIDPFVLTGLVDGHAYSMFNIHYRK